MNKHQKIAFGAFAVLAFAFIIAFTYSTDGLGLMAVLALMIALLTLPAVWRVIYGLIQLVASTVAFIGHGIGKVGDIVADFAFTRREGLSSRNKVPGWDTLAAVSTDTSRASIDDLLQPHPHPAS